MDLTRLVDPVLAWLGRCQEAASGYDAGAVFDPLDKRVVGDHYAATHFAWCCAVRHADRPDPRLVHQARRAIGFHLRTSPEEYPPGNWSYHWDFNNLAFIETFLLLGEHLDEDERAAWLAGLGSWKINAHWAVNWVAMRALSHFKRHDVLGRPEDLTAAQRWLVYVLGAQKHDGGIEDIPEKSLPSQYHAYSACLLHRMLPRHASVAEAVRRAARWLLAVTAPDGEMNALGRGQGQIFGYACAVYLFRAAVSLDPELAPNYRWAARAVTARLAEAQSPEGYWPLVLNREPLENRAGWYDYHHLSVYNAFAAVWLTLAAAVPEPAGPLEAPAPGVAWLKDSGLLAVRRKGWFALFCAGREGDGYRTEAGVTPHQILWGGHDLFRYPLGPGTGKYGSRSACDNQEAHVWAPMWRARDGEWEVPAGVEGTLEPDARTGRWRLESQAGGALWRRELLLGRRFLEARDVLDAPGEAQSMEPGAVRLETFALGADRPRQTGPAFVRDQDSAAVLRVWGGELAQAGRVVSAQGATDILAVTGKSGTPSGWRLRQGPAEIGGPLPGIVCLSWDPWSTLWKRKQRLLFELARLGLSPKTLYVEPARSITSVVEGLGGLFGPEGAGLRRCLGGRPADMGHGFSLGSPLLPMPGQRTFPALARCNRRAWLSQVRRYVRSTVFPEGYVLWLYHPSQLDALDALGDDAELVVYDWTDDWAAALPADRPDEERRVLEGRQRELLQRADVVFAVSLALAERAGRWCPHVHHLPNATDPEVFKPHDPSAPRHPLAARRPLMVYLSQITERLDVGLVAELARARPQWSVVLAGPVVCAPSLLASLNGLANVALAGALPYEEAAALTAQADVCILPHRQDALTRTLDPIKLYDYLATGRPIVSTDVAMHPELAGLVRVASGPEAFIAAVESALAEDPAQGERRRQSAGNHCWTVRARQAAAVLERFFPQE